MEAEPVKPGSSLISRLFNIYATPGDVFDEVAVSPPRASNWVVPMLLNVVLSMAFVLFLFSQPAILQSFREQQAQAIEQQVQKGKLTEAQATQALEAMEKFAPMYKIFGAVGAVVGTCAMMFVVGLLAWLIVNKAFKGQVEFMRVMDVVGLAGMITLLNTIVTIPLATLKGSMMVSAGPALLVPNLEPGSPVFAALASLNVFMLWWAAVLALGVAKLARVPYGRAAAWVFGVYFLISAVFVGFAVLRS